VIGAVTDPRQSITRIETTKEVFGVLYAHLWIRCMGIRVEPIEVFAVRNPLITRRAEFHGLCPWVNVKAAIWYV
jgi:hypothetical protein